MATRHPFQKICHLRHPSRERDILLTATGPSILSFDLKEGTLLAKWPTDYEDEFSQELYGNGQNRKHADSQRPQKKQKLADESREEGSRESSISVEIVAERLKGQRRKRKLVEAKLPRVSHILTTKNQLHVISVTSDDKCIRVFDISSEGRLKILSQRFMPKRLCAIVLSPDESTLLAGDKFGDVYSLPLHPPVLENHSKPQSTRQTTDFKSSATELTVHTKGNREALRQQQKQRASVSRKEGPSFEHKLLLGHVSLLTDLITVSVPVNGKPRQYILTADRDEHIRVSRGLPQVPIIETHCLGHKDFVSKICVLPWQPSILLAGSGEPSLRSFEWRHGHPLGDAMNVREVTEDITSVISDISYERASNKLAVSGIWTIQCGELSSMSDVFGLVLVAIEGLPLLLSYKKTLNEDFQYHGVIRLQGNALDVAIIRDQQTILVSVDSFHCPGSMKSRRSDTYALDPQIQSFTLHQPQWSASALNPNEAKENLNSLRWHPSELADKLNRTVAEYEDPTPTPDISSDPTAKETYSILGEFLYGLENLRKKTSNDTENQYELEDVELQEEDLDVN